MTCFLLQDPDGDEAKEEAGTVRRALQNVALSFDSVELGMKHLINKQGRETGSPKGVCWLCVKCCQPRLTLSLANIKLFDEVVVATRKPAVVGNVLHTVSNACKVTVLPAQLRWDFRLPHEDQDKEDESGLVKRCLRLRTLSQKSTGCEQSWTRIAVSVIVYGHWKSQKSEEERRI